MTDSLPPHPSCLVLIPTYNERANLPVLVRQLIALPRVDVLILDDASPDGTGEVADALHAEFGDRVRVRHRPGRSGLGAAYVDGMRAALDSGHDLIAQMDADLSHDVKYLPQLIAATREAEVAIGSRYVPGGGVKNWPVSRQLLSKYANWYVRQLTGIPVRDCTAGYRCWRREALARMPLDRLFSNGYAFQVEMTWEAVRRSMRIAEVPIVFFERRDGRSKMSWAVIAESVLLPWRLKKPGS